MPVPTRSVCTFARAGGLLGHKPSLFVTPAHGAVFVVVGSPPCRCTELSLHAAGVPCVCVYVCALPICMTVSGSVAEHVNMLPESASLSS